MIDSRAQMALLYLWSIGYYIRCETTKNDHCVLVHGHLDTRTFYAMDRDRAIEAAARHYGWKG